MTRRVRALAAYLALLALALQAVWPLLAQAAPARTALMPVCTVDGVTHFTEVPIRAGAADDSAAAHADHCAFCPLGGDRPVAPSQDFSAPLCEPEPSVWIREDPTGLHGSIPLSEARPRAPPFLRLAMNFDQLRRIYEKEPAVGRIPIGAPAV